MTKKLLLLTFIFTFLFIGSLTSLAEAQNTDIEELQSQKERIETIKETVTYLIPLARAQGREEIAEILEELLERTKNINERIENKLNEGGVFECLAKKGVVVYGTEWCPACAALIEEWGGREAVDPIYVDCNISPKRCDEEMKTHYVPEIQIKGEIYKESRELGVILQKAGCQ